MKKFIVLSLFLTLSNISLAFTCPTISTLTTSCGNGVIDVGETKENCATDVVDPSKQAKGFYAEINTCDKSDIFVPTTIEDFQQTVRNLVAKNQKFKIKGTGHSTSPTFCSTIDGAVIYTHKLKSISEVESYKGQDSVVIEAGVTYGELAAKLIEVEKTIGYTITGVSYINVVGTINTGVHGSGRAETSSISSRVLEIDVIENDGTIKTYNEDNTTEDEWKFLRTPLGVVNIAKVRLKVDDGFALYNRNIVGKWEDLSTVEGIRKHYREDQEDKCDYSFTFAFVKEGEIVTSCASERPLSDITDPTVQTTLFAPEITDFEGDTAKTIFQAAFCTDIAADLVSSLQVGRLTDAVNASFASGSKEYIGPAVGHANRINNITKTPVDETKINSLDFEIVIKLEDVPAALEAAKRIFNEHGRNPFLGIVIRRDIATADTLMGGNAVREGIEVGDEIVHIETATYYPYEASQETLDAGYEAYYKWYEWIIDNYEYAHLHWGKNNYRLFDYLVANSDQMKDRLAKFQVMVDRFDPYGIHKNEYLERLGITWPRDGEQFSSFIDPAETSIYSVDIKEYQVKNRHSNKCMKFIGSDNPTSSFEVFGMIPAEVRDCNTNEYRQRFILWEKGASTFTDQMWDDMLVKVYPLVSPFLHRLDQHNIGDFRFVDYQDGSKQKFTLNKVGSYWEVKGKAWVPCMAKLAGSNAISGMGCGFWGGNRIDWSFNEVGQRVMPIYAGIAGDRYWLEVLGTTHSLDMGNIGQYTDMQLSAYINDSDYKSLTVKIVSDYGVGMPGVEACLSWTGIGKDGRALTCGYADSAGEIKFIGVPYHISKEDVKPRLGNIE